MHRISNSWILTGSYGRDIPVLYLFFEPIIAIGCNTAREKHTLDLQLVRISLYRLDNTEIFDMGVIPREPIGQYEYYTRYIFKMCLFFFFYGGST